MKYLLDTHTFLWFVAGSSQMSERAIELIEKENNEIFFSFASVWEMSIKSSLGKLQLTLPFSDFIQQEIEESSIILL